MSSCAMAVLSIATLLWLSCLGCQDKAPTAQGRYSQKAPIEVATVHAQAVTDRLELAARVEPDPTRVVHIYSQVTGRLVELYVRPGQEVKKDQTIGLIQSSEITEARADYDKAKIEVARSDHQLDRAKLLLQHEVMAQRDYDDIEAANQAAHAELTRTIQRIHMLGFSPEGSSDTVALRAPISGAVLEIGTASGEMQRSLDNASPIATIANLDPVWILGDVFERDLGTLRSAQSVDVTLPAYPGETLHGRISNISDAMDPHQPNAQGARGRAQPPASPQARNVCHPLHRPHNGAAIHRAHSRSRSRRFVELRFHADCSGEV